MDSAIHFPYIPSRRGSPAAAPHFRQTLEILSANPVWPPARAPCEAPLPGFAVEITSVSRIWADPVESAFQSIFRRVRRRRAAAGGGPAGRPKTAPHFRQTLGILSANPVWAPAKAPCEAPLPGFALEITSVSRIWPDPMGSALQSIFRRFVGNGFKWI